MLLKVELLAYSRGIVSSRAVERACREHVTFIALSGVTCPHLARTVKRQRTILGRLMRDVQRSVNRISQADGSRVGAGTTAGASGPSNLALWLERAERIRTQQHQDKHKLYALHAPEVECIGKGRARKPS